MCLHLCLYIKQVFSRSSSTYKDGVFSQGLSPSRTTSVLTDGGRRGLPGDDISVTRLSLSATKNEKENQKL